MPYSLAVDHQARLVRIKWSGVCDAGEFREIMMRMLDGSLPANYSGLNDFRAVDDVHYDHSDVVDIAMKRRVALGIPRREEIRAAIFGVHRAHRAIFAAWPTFFCRDGDYMFEIFDSEIEALEWLGFGEKNGAACVT